MDTVNTTKQPCCKCNKGGATFTCDGCHQSFCIKHTFNHREELSQQMDNVGQEHDTLKRDIDEQIIKKTLLAQIDRWEKESIEKVQYNANEARSDLKRLTEESKNRLNDMMSKLSNELRRSREDDSFTEKNISQWMVQLEKLRKNLNTSTGIELILKDDSSSLRLITIKDCDKARDEKTDSSSQNTNGKLNEADASDKILQKDYSSTPQSELSIKTNISSPLQSSLYLSMIFGLGPSRNQDMQRLFKHLMSLSPMDKNGPMSGRCEAQTSQMKQFISETFGFKNVPGEYIVQGVKSFRLDRPPHSMDPNTLIHFPKRSSDSFVMTANEIVDWQRSYKVYASKNVKGLDQAFVHRALQGQSKDGEEAFRMKFVVRISTCPILMEFDAKTIPRKLDEKWPNRIKLISVTGIDFPGQIHDVCDIIQYISNWKDIYEFNPKTSLPLVYNRKDFRVKRTAPPVKLNEDVLSMDLKLMVRLRLRACDKEGVQVVVETGIGLEVLSGEYTRIEGTVRGLSALAIRTVLEEDGHIYNNIRAVVFALPTIDENHNSERTRHCFNDFNKQFQEPQYKGPVPVLIADQDMHRLTVAIAKYGFVVSQLNPAGSQGVFGEYWQNEELDLEGKLALTTLGLLVQHHLINRHVLDPNNHRLI